MTKRDPNKRKSGLRLPLGSCARSRSIATCSVLARHHPAGGAALLFVLAMLAGCDRLDMYDQPRYEPLEASDFFGDGLSARPPVEGTIPRGGLRDDEPFYLGKERGQAVSRIPDAAYRAVYDRNPRHFGKPYDEIDEVDLRRALLERGRERFEIHCTACHGRAGDGTGMIVRRGFRAPPSYHIARLREAPAGHFFDVATNGFGAMASYAARVDVGDRWAIVAYIRALQLSQNASVDDVPADERDDLAKSQEEAAKPRAPERKDAR